jgi:hypothetical protein
MGWEHKRAGGRSEEVGEAEQLRVAVILSKAKEPKLEPPGGKLIGWPPPDARPRSFAMGATVRPYA